MSDDLRTDYIRDLIRPGPDPEYHRHYPDQAKDYWARLIAAAPRMGDYKRLMCYKY